MRPEPVFDELDVLVEPDDVEPVEPEDFDEPDVPDDFDDPDEPDEPDVPDDFVVDDELPDTAESFDDPELFVESDAELLDDAEPPFNISFSSLSFLFSVSS